MQATARRLIKGEVAGDSAGKKGLGIIGLANPLHDAIGFADVSLAGYLRKHVGVEHRE